MIQPLKTSKNHWFLYWVDLEEPLPTGADWFLPTLVILCDRSGTPLAPPEIMEELDQNRIEDFLYKAFDKLGLPDRLSLSSSEEWNTDAWRNFSADCKVDICFQLAGNKSPAELHTITKTLVMRICEELDTPSHKREIAQGLLRTALRVRSRSKKIALLRAALAHDAECSAARIELADFEFQSGNWKSCLAAYEEVIQKQAARWTSSHVDWWENRETRPYLRAIYGKSMTQWRLGRYAMAAQTLEMLLACNPTDNQGARFLIPMLHLLAESHERAAAFFLRYQENYPCDYAEPAFLFGWALSCSLEGNEQEARSKYIAGILRNIYIAPLLLEQNEPARNFWLPNDRAEPVYAEEFVESYGVLWDREPSALRLLREVYQEILPRIEKIVIHRERMTDFQDQRYKPDYKEVWQKLIAKEEQLTMP